MGGGSFEQLQRASGGGSERLDFGFLLSDYLSGT
jgi:hypothetical protein